MASVQCPSFYELEGEKCIHILDMFSFETFIASILLMVAAGLSSMAGLGGGGPAIIVQMLFLHYLPKDATIVVFCNIFGASLGSALTQMRKSLDGQPLIKYELTVVVLPLMFFGSFLGISINRVMPSVVVCGIISYFGGLSLPNIIARFLTEYKKESVQNGDLTKSLTKKQFVRINPFDSSIVLLVLKRLGLIVAAYLGLSSIRGTERLPSIIGIIQCSFLYWSVQVIIFVSMGFFAWDGFRLLSQLQQIKEQQSLKDKSSQYEMMARVEVAGQKIQSHVVRVSGTQKGQHANGSPAAQMPEESIKNLTSSESVQQIAYNSIMAGVFSGFGVGGGLFLAPLYRSMGCNAISASASCVFAILITSMINCMEGFLVGLIHPIDLLYHISVSAFGSLVMSHYLSTFLQRKNRMSLVDLLLFMLLSVSVFMFPISLYRKWVNSGYQNSIILGFKSLCR